MKTFVGYTPEELREKCKRMNQLIQRINETPVMPSISTSQDVIEWIAERGRYENWIYSYMHAFRHYPEQEVKGYISMQICPLECLNFDPETMKLSVKPEYL